MMVWSGIQLARLDLISFFSKSWILLQVTVSFNNTCVFLEDSGLFTCMHISLWIVGPFKGRLWIEKIVDFAGVLVAII